MGKKEKKVWKKKEKLRVRKMKWDDDHSRVIRGDCITSTGRMINGGILTGNGTKCSASPDQ